MRRGHAMITVDLVTTTTEDILNAFMIAFVNELDALMQVVPTLVGDGLGPLPALDAPGRCTSTALAATTNTNERYIDGWLPGQNAAVQ